MTSFVKNGLTIAGLLVIAFVGYYLYTTQGELKTGLSAELDVNEARVASEQFLRELNDIKNFDLSDELFADPRFRSFVDFTEPVPSQPVGRTNPFAPVQ